MGEAKMRGTFEQRQAEAVAKLEARKAEWNKAQAELRKQCLEEIARVEVDRPKESQSERPRRARMGSMGALAIAALLAAGMAKCRLTLSSG